MLKHVFVLFTSATLAVTGCKKSEPTTTAAAPNATDSTTMTADFPLVTALDLNTWLSEKKAVAVDANGEKTRTTLGIIPGAVLLTSSDEFAASELPADKITKLVFYCGNEQCSASHTAAAKAKALGYSDVVVFKGGIKGWVDAGLPTDKYAAAPTTTVPGTPAAVEAAPTAIPAKK